MMKPAVEFIDGDPPRRRQGNPSGSSGTVTGFIIGALSTRPGTWATVTTDYGVSVTPERRAHALRKWGATRGITVETAVRMNLLYARIVE